MSLHVFCRDQKYSGSQCDKHRHVTGILGIVLKLSIYAAICKRFFSGLAVGYNSRVTIPADEIGVNNLICSSLNAAQAKSH